MPQLGVHNEIYSATWVFSSPVALGLSDNASQQLISDRKWIFIRTAGLVNRGS